MFIIINTAFFLQMSIWRLWQASVPFYSHVHVFLFILVAFCDGKNNLLYLNG